MQYTAALARLHRAILSEDTGGKRRRGAAMITDGREESETALRIDLRLSLSLGRSLNESTPTNGFK